MKNEIKITFVKSPEEGEICAVFVNEFWDRSKTKLTSYMHIGQHAGIYGFINLYSGVFWMLVSDF